MTKFIIAEKPSVAKNIAEAVGAKTRRDGYYENEHYVITWAFGHLLELYDAKDYDEKLAQWRLENFPYIPEPFLYKVKDDQGAAKQLQTIKSLIERQDVDEVISACDYDREGQIIGDIILTFLNVQKKTSRILLNEWTPLEVLTGIENRISNEQMKPLSDAGITRQWSDWLIGINLTSASTLKYQRGKGKALNIGRVLLPTLKIIYDRDLEIEQFVKESFHKLVSQFKTSKDETYEGTYACDGVERFSEKESLDTLIRDVKDKMAYVVSREVESKREYAPLLFNLSGLQGYVTSKHKGWTSDQVLEVAQKLYEKKWITYPRTSSMALEETLVDKAARVLEVHKKGLPYEDQIVFNVNKRVFDNSKVESHSAIMPTYVLPKGMTADERLVFEAIRNRFIMQFMPVATHEEVTLITAIKGHSHAEYAFTSKGRTQCEEGWRIVEGIQSKEKDIPMVLANEEVQPFDMMIQTKSTSPPKRHTEKSLLKIMETCGKKMKAEPSENDDSEGEDDLGIDSDDVELMAAILSGFSIGTPATRAETISKLKRVGYIESKGKNLLCTQMGKRLVELFPIRELFDLEYTGRLEKTLFDIGKGDVQKTDFMLKMHAFIDQAVNTIKESDFFVIQDLGADERVTSNRTVLGKCPTCGAPVVEGEKGYGCTNWKAGCKFVVWKNDKFLQALQVTPSAQTIVKLLENGEVYSNRFVSKKGTFFSAYLSYQHDKESGYYKWTMRFS